MSFKIFSASFKKWTLNLNFRIIYENYMEYRL